ncbi:hypothetical protein U737_15420 [Methylomonas sp. LW13]|nr:hypothetical protein CWO84_22835 [Methylomonas sp. Kb3]QBC28173.1 hypothetical protein U737_15420 [Methylomonas sp. LW13]
MTRKQARQAETIHQPVFVNRLFKTGFLLGSRSLTASSGDFHRRKVSTRWNMDKPIDQRIIRRLRPLWRQAFDIITGFNNL